MKNNERRQPSTIFAIILGAIFGAAIGHYNGFFGWHDLKAVLVLALISSIVGVVAERAKSDMVARKRFRAAVGGGLIGIVFAVVVVVFSIEGKQYLLREAINWCISGMIVGLVLPTKLTLAMKIGAVIGLAAAFLSGLNQFDQQRFEIGDVHLLIANPYIFLMIEAVSGMLIGAWFGLMFDAAFTRKEHA